MPYKSIDVTDEYCTAYVGHVLADGSRALTDWRGDQIGTCRILWKERAPRSFWPTQWKIEATVEGRRYTGYSIGQWFIFRGRRVRQSRPT